MEFIQGPTSQEAILRHPQSFEAPLDFASLSDLHPGQNGKFIIHIQDAHSNFSAQDNLAGALRELMQKYDIQLVLSEGGYGDCTLSELREKAKPELIQRVARSFLRSGEIHGEEYLNLTDKRPMKIIGIEDKALYEEGLNYYEELADKREKVLGYLVRSRNAIEKLKVRFYPKELVDYERAGLARQDTEWNIEAFLSLATKHDLDLSSYSELLKLSEIKKTEDAIDFESANLEQSVLIEELYKRGAKETLESYLSKMKQMKGQSSGGKVSQFAYFEKTLSIAKEKGVDISRFPNLISYLNYLRAFSLLNFDLLLREHDSAEDALYKKILVRDAPSMVQSHNESQNDPLLLRAIDRFVYLLQTAHEIQMTADQFSLFKYNEAEFSTEAMQAFLNRKLAEQGYFEDIIPYEPLLDDARRTLDRFYDSVKRRDLAFMQNLETSMQNEDQKIAFLISGGYHTPHLKELLREKGYGYSVLTPIVTVETNQEKYEALLLNKDQKKRKKIQVVSGESKSQNKPLSVLDDDLAKLIKNKDKVRTPMVAVNSAVGARLAEALNVTNWISSIPRVPSKMPAGMDEVIDDVLSLKQEMRTQYPELFHSAQLRPNEKSKLRQALNKNGVRYLSQGGSAITFESDRFPSLVIKIEKRDQFRTYHTHVIDFEIMRRKSPEVVEKTLDGVSLTVIPGIAPTAFYRDAIIQERGRVSSSNAVDLGARTVLEKDLFDLGLDYWDPQADNEGYFDTPHKMAVLDLGALRIQPWALRSVLQDIDLPTSLPWDETAVLRSLSKLGYASTSYDYLSHPKLPEAVYYHASEVEGRAGREALERALQAKKFQMSRSGARMATEPGSIVPSRSLENRVAHLRAEYETLSAEWDRLDRYASNAVEQQRIAERMSVIATELENLGSSTDGARLSAKKMASDDGWSRTLSDYATKGVLYHQTWVGAVWMMALQTDGNLSKGTWFANNLPHDGSTRAKGLKLPAALLKKISSTPRIDLEFDANQLAALNIHFINDNGLIAMNDVPLKVLTPRSKKRVFEELISLSEKDPAYPIMDRQALAKILDYVDGARLAGEESVDESRRAKFVRMMQEDQAEFEKYKAYLGTLTINSVTSDPVFVKRVHDLKQKLAEVASELELSDLAKRRMMDAEVQVFDQLPVLAQVFFTGDQLDTPLVVLNSDFVSSLFQEPRLQSRGLYVLGHELAHVLLQDIQFSGETDGVDQADYMPSLEDIADMIAVMAAKRMTVTADHEQLPNVMVPILRSLAKLPELPDFWVGDEADVFNPDMPIERRRQLLQALVEMPVSELMDTIRGYEWGMEIHSGFGVGEDGARLATPIRSPADPAPSSYGALSEMILGSEYGDLYLKVKEIEANVYASTHRTPIGQTTAVMEHEQRVTEIAYRIGRQLGLNERELLFILAAAAVHDVGKTRVPPEVLYKQGKLSASGQGGLNEIDEMKAHVSKGLVILEGLGASQEILKIIAQHHEHLDGTGYPNAITGDAIDRLSRILTVADVYVANREPRSYRDPPNKTRVEALQILIDGKGSRYDADVVDALVTLEGAAGARLADPAQAWFWQNRNYAAAVPYEETVHFESDAKKARSPNQELYWERQKEMRRLFLDLMASHLESSEPVSLASYRDVIGQMNRFLLTGRSSALSLRMFGPKRIYFSPNMSEAYTQAEYIKIVSANAGTISNDPKVVRSVEKAHQSLMAYLQASATEPSEWVRLTAEYYLDAMEEYPFEAGNNSLFMNIVNAMLRLRGLKGIPHSHLDDLTTEVAQGKMSRDEAISIISEYVSQANTLSGARLAEAPDSISNIRPDIRTDMLDALRRLDLELFSEILQKANSSELDLAHYLSSLADILTDPGLKNMADRVRRMRGQFLKSDYSTLIPEPYHGLFLPRSISKFQSYASREKVRPPTQKALWEDAEMESAYTEPPSLYFDLEGWVRDYDSGSDVKRDSLELGRERTVLLGYMKGYDIFRNSLEGEQRREPRLAVTGTDYVKRLMAEQPARRLIRLGNYGSPYKTLYHVMVQVSPSRWLTYTMVVSADPQYGETVLKEFGRLRNRAQDVGAGLDYLPDTYGIHIGASVGERFHTAYTRRFLNHHGAIRWDKRHQRFGFTSILPTKNSLIATDSTSEVMASVVAIITALYRPEARKRIDGISLDSGDILLDEDAMRLDADGAIHYRDMAISDHTLISWPATEDLSNKAEFIQYLFSWSYLKDGEADTFVVSSQARDALIKGTFLGLMHGLEAKYPPRNDVPDKATEVAIDWLEAYLTKVVSREYPESKIFTIQVVNDFIELLASGARLSRQRDGDVVAQELHRLQSKIVRETRLRNDFAWRIGNIRKKLQRQNAPISFTDAEIRTLESFLKQLYSYHPLVALRMRVSPQDRIITFNQANAKYPNDKIGKIANDHIIAVRHKQIQHSMRKHGLLADEVPSLNETFKEDKFVISADRLRQLDKNGPWELERRLALVVQEVQAELNSLIGRNYGQELAGYQFQVFVGVSAPVESTSADHKKSADLQAYQAAKEAKRLSEDPAKLSVVLYDAFEAAEGVSLTEARAQDAARYRAQLGLANSIADLPIAMPSDSEMMAVRGRSLQELAQLGDPRKVTLKKYLDLIDYFDYPKGWIEDDDVQEKKLKIIEELAVMISIIIERADQGQAAFFPESKPGEAIEPLFALRLRQALSILRTNLKQSDVTSEAEFHERAMARDGFFISYDAANFYAFTVRQMAEAHLLYLDDKNRSPMTMLKYALRADDNVKRMMVDKTRLLLNLIKAIGAEHKLKIPWVPVTSLNGKEGQDTARLVLREGGDEVVIFVRGEATEKVLRAILDQDAKQPDPKKRLNGRLVVSERWRGNGANYTDVVAETMRSYSQMFFASQAIEATLKELISEGKASSETVLIQVVESRDGMPIEWKFVYPDASGVIQIKQVTLPEIMGARLSRSEDLYQQWIRNVPGLEAVVHGLTLSLESDTQIVAELDVVGQVPELPKPYVHILHYNGVVTNLTLGPVDAEQRSEALRGRAGEQLIVSIFSWLNQKGLNKVQIALLPDRIENSKRFFDRVLSARALSDTSYEYREIGGQIHLVADLRSFDWEAGARLSLAELIVNGQLALIYHTNSTRVYRDLSDPTEFYKMALLPETLEAEKTNIGKIREQASEASRLRLPQVLEMGQYDEEDILDETSRSWHWMRLRMPEATIPMTGENWSKVDTYVDKLKFLLSLARQLDAMHEAGWVHGDVKYDNIVLGAAHQAYLIDFHHAQPMGDVITNLSRSSAKALISRSREVAEGIVELNFEGLKVEAYLDIVALGDTLRSMIGLEAIQPLGLSPTIRNMMHGLTRDGVHPDQITSMAPVVEALQQSIQKIESGEISASSLPPLRRTDSNIFDENADFMSGARLAGGRSLFLSGARLESVTQRVLPETLDKATLNLLAGSRLSAPAYFLAPSMGAFLVTPNGTGSVLVNGMAMALPAYVAPEKVTAVSPTRVLDGMAKEYGSLLQTGLRAIPSFSTEQPVLIVRSLDTDTLEAEHMGIVLEALKERFDSSVFYEFTDPKTGARLTELSSDPALIPANVQRVWLAEATEANIQAAIKADARFVSTESAEFRSGEAAMLPLAASLVAAVIVGRSEQITGHDLALQFFRRLTRVSFGQDQYALYVRPSVQNIRQLEAISIKSLARVAIAQALAGARLALQAIGQAA